MNLLKTISDNLFSTRAASIYILLFAVAIGVATFVENDFGTSSAQNVIFKSKWFELILLLFAISLIVNIFRFRMIQQKKWAILTFHASIVLILIGAGVTRYFGSEGMMHIREGQSSNTFLSSESYLLFEAVKDGKEYQFEEPVQFSTLGKNQFSKSYLLGSDNVDVEVLHFIPNPGEVLVDDANGVPILKIVIGGQNGREEYYLMQNERKNIHGLLYNFRDAEEPQAFNVKYENGELFFKADFGLAQMQMATQQSDTLSPGEFHPLLLRSLYSGASHSFVIGEFKPKGHVKIVPTELKMSSTSMAGLHMKIGLNDEHKSFYLFGRKGAKGTARSITIGNTSFSISFGSKSVHLPFSLKLNKFIMDRYPGTNSASSYASEITLLDPKNNIDRDQRIYMNNILNYGGYRFFQSSFDQDELGTYLSVNNDGWGTWISYIGYTFLTLGMIITMFSGKSRFRKLSKNIEKLRKSDATMAIMFFVFSVVLAIPTHTSAETIPQENPVNLQHAEQFGSLVVQDQSGRFKPMNTLVNEILRKISRKESINGLSAEQVILGMIANPMNWYGEPIIKLGKHEELRKILKVNDERASYRDFFDMQGNYKLLDVVRKAYNTPQIDRGVFEKELLKADERVNICNMIFSGRFMKVFPIQDDVTNHWQSPSNSHGQHDGHNHEVSDENTMVEMFYPAYVSALQSSIENNDWTMSNELIAGLSKYQQTYGGDILPSKSEMDAEILLNKLRVFDRLGKVYGLLGLIFLILLFISVFNPALNMKWPYNISFAMLALSFAMHTLGLGLRWYVSGRAPWSNGYESMIYIAFTTILAGLIFSRKSFGGLAATSVLASTILMVAGLSWLDPEITPLVPVLKSYWLTIHVSLIAGSYGFLMLGAIIGILNLVLMIFRTSKSRKSTNRIIKEMTYINEMTLICGIFLISIGTYLGGVWANESWGRYWGWDAKETWALVTILVYAFILHMRFIPGLKSAYIFNVASLFGLASVMMTYFGVNYYLSGLHSYAAGDPVPVPPFVYYTVYILIAISLLAFWRNQQFDKAKLSKSRAKK